MLDTSTVRCSYLWPMLDSISSVDSFLKLVSASTCSPHLYLKLIVYTTSWVLVFLKCVNDFVSILYLFVSTRPSTIFSIDPILEQVTDTVSRVQLFPRPVFDSDSFIGCVTALKRNKTLLIDQSS